MIKATDAVSGEERKKVELAVQQAEAKTSCEIVPVVVTQSGRYDRPEDIVGLWMAVLTAILVWMFVPHHSAQQPGDWAGISLGLQLLILVAGMVVAFVAGAYYASLNGWLLRLFTSQNEMIEEVTRKSREIFFDKRVHHTQGSTGLLFYVSLFEHRAVVLGDQTVLDNVGQEFLDNLCKTLTADLKKGSVADALCDVIRIAGDKLAESLPQEDGDANEIADTLILIDDSP